MSRQGSTAGSGAVGWQASVLIPSFMGGAHETNENRADAMLQDIGEGTVGKGNPTRILRRFGVAPFGRDVLPGEVLEQHEYVTWLSDSKSAIM
jgi:hypothetical protein